MPDRDLNVALVIRGEDRSRGAVRSARRGLDSVHDGLARIRRVAAGVLIGGGVLETLRRGAAHSVRTFSAVEDGLVGVAKTADLTEAQVASLDRRLSSLSLDPRIGLARPALLEIAQAAGQLGVEGVDNLIRFTATIAKLEGATDLAGAEGATSLARILNVTGEGPEQIERLGSVIVRLGNSFAATESEITGAATRVATATARYPVSAAEAVALGAALRALGIEAEQGGTAVGRGFGAIDAALREGGEGARRLAAITGRSIEELREAFAEDAVGVFREFVEGLGRVHEGGGDVAGVLEDLDIQGERAIAVYGTLATQAGTLARALDAASDEVERNTALNEEALRAAGTFSRQLQLVRNEIDIQAAALGGVLAPALLAAAQSWEVLGLAAVGALGRLTGGGLNAAVSGLRDFRRSIIETRRAAIAQTSAALEAAAARRAETAATVAAAEAQRRYQLSLLRAASRSPLASAAFDARKLSAATVALGAARAADTAATATQTAAQTAHTAALTRASIVARGLQGALRLLGGPIGLITTALSLGAAAWALWGSSADTALDERIEAVLASREGVIGRVTRLIGEQREHLAALGSEHERIAERLAGVEGTSPAARLVRSGDLQRLAEIEREAGSAGERLRELFEYLAELRQREAEPGRTGPGIADAGLGGADEDTAEALTEAARRANDELARLTLDRISLINREERQAIAELEALQDLSVEQERQRQGAIDGIRAAAQLRRDQALQDEIAAEEAAAQARLDAQRSAVQEAHDAALADAERIEAARQAAIAGIERGAATLATPYERAIDGIERWEAATRTALDEAGAATEQYTRLAEIAAERRAQADEAEAQRRLQASTRFEDGVTRGLREIQRRTEDFAGQAERLVGTAFSAAGDAVEEFVRTGKLSFRGFVEDLLVQLARVQADRALLGLIAAVAGRFSFGGAPGTAFTGADNFGVLHGGGTAGQLGGVRRTGVSPAAFLGAPRYHFGGVAGDEVPSILRRGETVRTREQERALLTRSVPPVIIEFHNEGTAQEETNRDTRFDGESWVISIATDDVERGGRLARAISRMGAVA